MPMRPTTHVMPLNDANRLGLNYRHEAARLPWPGAIWDVHTHIRDVHAARAMCHVADLFHVERTWSMTNLEEIDAIRAEFGPRIQFIAVPNYARRFEPDTFASDWLRRIEGFAAKGVMLCKFWAAPRGLDLSDHLRLDSPIRREAMKLARSLGMMFMTHVGDPDTWFATHYRDHRKYGRKIDHYAPLERLLDDYHDVPWIAAHMAGHPEDLDHLQQLLDRHPNLYLDTSATKWMIRELSKHPHAFRDFCRHNPNRILFGSDIVASPPANSNGQVKGDVGGEIPGEDFDLLASRYWALRTLFETAYDGPSPIVDPDLSLIDPTLPREAAAAIHGASFDPTTLANVYGQAARRLLSRYMSDV